MNNRPEICHFYICFSIFLFVFISLSHANLPILSTSYRADGTTFVCPTVVEPLFLAR